ncbi:UNVERIFIED_CONTAM: hypothetical protein RMT77_007980 [Armadillidium vulgare]
MFLQRHFCGFLIVTYFYGTYHCSAICPYASNDVFVKNKKSCVPKFDSDLLLQSSRNMLSDILTQTLAGENLFIITDEILFNDNNVNKIIRKTASVTPVIIDTLQNFDETTYHISMIKGHYFTMVLLLYSSYFNEFINYIAVSVRWAPSKLVIISLNPHKCFNNNFYSTVVQRSEFIFLSEVACMQDTPVTNTFTIYPHMKGKSRLDIEKLSLGIWKGPRKKNEIFINRLKNFQAQNVKLGYACDDFPFLYKDVTNKKPCIGSNIDILSIIEEDLNFTLIIQPDEGHFWGTYVNGSWNGVLGDLSQDQRDIAVNLFVHTEERDKDFEFSSSYEREGYGFLVMLPSPVPNWKRTFMPFSFDVWILTFVSLLIVIYFYFTLKNRTSKTLNYTIIDTAVLFLRMSLRQSSYQLFFIWELWSRIWIGIWLVSFFILTSAYTGVLVSFLTVSRYPDRTETLKELVESEYGIIMSNYGSNVPEQLMTSSNSLLRSVGKRLEVIPYEMGYEYMIDFVKSRRYVLLESHSYLINIQSKYNVSDQTYMMDEEVYQSYLSFVYPKGSILKHAIDNVLADLVETGITSFIFRKHMLKSLKPNDEDHEVLHVPLKLTHLQSAFFILLIGEGIALIVFFFEFTRWKHLPNIH